MQRERNCCCCCFSIADHKIMKIPFIMNHNYRDMYEWMEMAKCANSFLRCGNPAVIAKTKYNKKSFMITDWIDGLHKS